MVGYNRIIIAGNLTRDPEYKQLDSGQAVCKLGLASNRQYKNRQTGMQMQDVCYVDIDVWGPQADSCNQYLQKGRPVLVEGRLKFDSWKDQEGQTRSKHSIVADRVIFLSQQNDSTKNDRSSQESSHNQDDVTFSTQNTEQFQKAAQAVQKKKTQQKSVGQSSNQADIQGSSEFKDQPPFEDDLPF